jgi:hypothetical protein
MEALSVQQTVDFFDIDSVFNRPYPAEVNVGYDDGDDARNSS